MQTQPPIQIPHYSDDFENNFPANLVPRDPYDDVYFTKSRNAQSNIYTGKPTTTVHKLTKEDIEYQKRKAAVTNNLRYQTWLLNAIDMKNPKSGKGPIVKIKKPTKGLSASITRQNKTGTTPKNVSRRMYKKPLQRTAKK